MDTMVDSNPEKLTRRQQKQRDRDSKKLVRCFVCGTQMYPRVIIDPKTEREKKAIFCASCHANLPEVLEARKKLEETMSKFSQEQSTDADTENPTTSEHEPGIQDGGDSSNEPIDS